MIKKVFCLFALNISRNSNYCLSQILQQNMTYNCSQLHSVSIQCYDSRISGQDQTELHEVSNFNSFHVSVCPEAVALLNPMCCVALALPETDFRWSYFLTLSTVWVVLTNVGSVEWLEKLEWQWPTNWWPGWKSVMTGIGRWEAAFSEVDWAKPGLRIGWRTMCCDLRLWLCNREELEITKKCWPA